MIAVCDFLSKDFYKNYHKEALLWQKTTYGKKSEIIGRCRESNQDFNSVIHLVMEEMIGHKEPGKFVCRKIIEYSIASVG